MSELTHDPADDGFHEIQLSGKQLVALFIITTTVIVVVFLCGVKVGRGARSAQGEDPEQIAASSATATAPQPATNSGPPAADPPAPAAETPELTYPKTLQADAPADSLKPPADSKSKEQPKPKDVAKPKDTPSLAPAPAAAPPPAAAVAEAGVPLSGRAGTWAVQVLATRDRAVASSVVKRLAGKGYPAFLVTPPAGQPFFKVHVGRYNDRAEAEKTSARIKQEEQFQSWITR